MEQHLNTYVGFLMAMRGFQLTQDEIYVVWKECDRFKPSNRLNPKTEALLPIIRLTQEGKSFQEVLRFVQEA